MEKKIQLIAQKIRDSKHLVFFTGAGISTESGIPDFRSKGGIWDKFTPIYFDEFMSSKNARIEYWKRRLEMEKSLSVAKPNIGHMSIAKLNNLLKAVITQNIDGLHQEAGVPSEKIIELHGNTRKVRCMSCNKIISFNEAKAMIKNKELAPKCSCSGYFKPDTISFGQAMPKIETQKAIFHASKSDVFIVVGSTLLVHPAATLPEYAKRANAFLVIINLSSTPYDNLCDVLIREKAGTTLSKILQHRFLKYETKIQSKCKRNN